MSQEAPGVRALLVPVGSGARVVAALIFLILVELVVAQSLNLFPRVPMIDFYQYWGVAAARRVSSEALGTPYTDGQRYRAVLADYAARSHQSKIGTVKPPDFTATPFAYMLFAALPVNYARAALMFHALQILLFLAAVIHLGRVYRSPLAPLLCLALLLVLGSGPLSSDLRLGNLACFRLFALAALLALLDRLPRVRRAAMLEAVAFSGLLLLALVTPSVALVTAIIALHLWLAHGTRLFAIAAVPALLSATAAVIASCAYFGSWSVWDEWYRAVFGADPYRLIVNPAMGNYSTTLLLSLWLRADVWVVAMLVAGAVIISLRAVTATAAKADAGPRAMPPRRALARALRDPHLAMAMGVTMTMAISPLFWYHDYLVALIPGLWLLNASPGPGYPALWGLAALILSSGLQNVLFIPLGWTSAVAISAALSWVPLWVGILLRIYRPSPPLGSGAPT